MRSSHSIDRTSPSPAQMSGATSTTDTSTPVPVSTVNPPRRLLDLSADMPRDDWDGLDPVFADDCQSVPNVDGASPLSPEQFETIKAADARKLKIDKAAGVAGFNAWSSTVLAAFSLLSAIFDPWSLVAAIGLAVVAANEFKGRAQLRAMEPRSLTRLMWNQGLFALMIISYSAVQIIGATTGPGRYDAYMSDPALAKMLGPIGDMHTNITLSVYISAIALSIVIQGSTALYYRRKRAMLECYLSETPMWVLALQRHRA